jgi:ubiquinone/menaquinone biosynthesis C-methylase UbiE
MHSGKPEAHEIFAQDHTQSELDGERPEAMRLSLQRIRRGFDQIAADYASVQAATASREVREFVRWVRPTPSECILDAACGTARLARSLARHARQVHALELSERMIHLARRPGLPVCLTVGDVEKLPYASRSFELVTCAYAFANFPRPLRVLREFARVTADQGRIAILDVIAPEDPAKRAWLNRLERVRSPFYTRILPPSRFAALFRAARLALEELQFHRRYQQGREWLRLSPAAVSPERARRLGEALFEAVKRDQAGLTARVRSEEIVLCYHTAWFLLRPVRRAPQTR